MVVLQGSHFFFLKVYSRTFPGHFSAATIMTRKLFFIIFSTVVYILHFSCPVVVSKYTQTEEPVAAGEKTHTQSTAGVTKYICRSA